MESFATASMAASSAVRVSKKGDAELAESGLDYDDYLSALRGEGLGGIIKETVNAKTLQSAITAYVEEHALTAALIFTSCSAAMP